MIPADEAREIAETTMSEEVESYLSEIDTKIRRAAASHEHQVTVRYLGGCAGWQIRVIKALEESGYEVDNHAAMDQRDDSYTTVKW